MLVLVFLLFWDQRTVIFQLSGFYPTLYGLPIREAPNTSPMRQTTHPGRAYLKRDLESRLSNWPFGAYDGLFFGLRSDTNWTYYVKRSSM